jgi:hypothetical protein
MQLQGYQQGKDSSHVVHTWTRGLAVLADLHGRGVGLTCPLLSTTPRLLILRCCIVAACIVLKC